MDNSTKDANLWLAFLIANQDFWKPELDIHVGGGQTRRVPLTLVADVRE